MKTRSLPKLQFVLAAIALPLLASGQGLANYLKVRHKYGITQAVGVEALDAFVGSRVVEVKGTVKGSFSSGEHGILELERESGKVIDVQADPPPSWLVGNEVPVRLILSASRSGERAQLHCMLMVAAPEQDIAPIDAAAEAAERKRLAARKNRPSATPPTKKAAINWSLPYSEVVPVYAQFIRRDNSRLSPEEALKIAEGIVGFSLKYGVDARLIMAMVMVESDFNPGATSRKGAMGLGQLMPGNAKDMGINNAYDSTENLYATVRLVRDGLNQYNRQTGDGYEGLVLMLAAYNAGDGAVRRAHGIPPYRETQRYVKRVVQLYRQFTGQN